MKTTQQMIEVMQAFIEGKKIEYAPHQRLPIYRDMPFPVWDWVGGDYRIKEEPNVVIPWDSILPEFRWAAVDAGGRVYVYEEKPYMGEVHWNSSGRYAAVSDVLNIKPTDRHWKETLQGRPAA